MAYGAASFAQGLMGGLQTGFELADIRKEKKREKIAAEVAKEKVAADGVPTFDASQLQQQERLMPALTEGMDSGQLADYASLRRVPLGVEKSQELGRASPDMGAIPMPDINARKPRVKTEVAPAAFPTPKAAPVAESPELIVTAKPKMEYVLKDGKPEYVGALTAADEVAAPQYQVYKDTFGRERYTTQLRDRSKEEVAFDTAARLQSMGDTAGYEKYMKMYDTELERSSKKQAREMTDGLRQINAGLLTGKSDLMAKGLKNVFGAMQGNNDGVTYDMVRSSDGSQITLVGVDTASGLPLPSSIKDAPPGTLAVFKADPASGMPAEAVMAGQLASIATPEGMFNWTKQVMLGRKAVADLANTQASTAVNQTRAELMPKEFEVEKTYKLGTLGVAQQNANTAAFRAANSGSSGAGVTKAQAAWDKSVNGYVAKVMSESGLQPGTPQFNQAAANARNGALQIFGPPPGTQFFDATTPSAPGAGGNPPGAAIPAAPPPPPERPKPTTPQQVSSAVAAAKAAGKRFTDLQKKDSGYLWEVVAENNTRKAINDAVAAARGTGKPEYKQGARESESAYRVRIANSLGLTYPK